MIIKPWTDLPPPRHTLNEQLEEEDPSVPARDIVIPKIDVELLLNNELQAVDYLLVLPQRLDRIVLGLSANDKIEKIGKIKIEYVLSKPSSIKVTEEEKEEEEEEYNEDEQLYLVGTAKQLDLKPVEIIINKVKINEKTYLNYIILPVFKELITYNLLAKAVLTKIASSFKKLITISINNNVESQTLAQL
ncbi:hypothetical protein PACTADRAFT_79042 [Pachysolen tannophilus NRRL Y-2460]|uniref:Uncharacterized protein n=1 Tax=Pachysolen tannophilus NRRL Y-2460 TaxID=669874 RepID=A0A1E4TXS1_PACTA|nr:hypothetical protein PACTADRAFT_79042 [Pachysolen tannophilus NRRL Y-2460]